MGFNEQQLWLPWILSYTCYSKLCNFQMKMSRAVMNFFSQIIILYICILTCFVNLSMKNHPPELWISLLSLSLGSILPSPKVKKRLSVDINSPPLSLPDSLA